MRLRVGSYNLQDLFLCGEAEPRKRAPALRALARSIDRIGCDLLCVQEVGSPQSLEQLNARLASPYAYTQFCQGNSARGIHLAFLSRVPLHPIAIAAQPLQDARGQILCDRTAPDEETTQPLHARRGPAVVQADCAGRRLLAVNVHLKSHASAGYEQLATATVREAESTQVRQLVRRLVAEQPDTPLVLAGDFNDSWHADALAPIRALDLSDPLGERLRNSGRNPSTYWRKRRARIDHVLLHAQPGLLHASGADIHTGAEAQRASDHYPVWVDLQWA